MKKSAYSSAAALLPILAGLGLAAPAQATQATGDVSVTINHPVTVSNRSNLNFGDFVPGTTISVFRLNPNNDALTQQSGNAIASGGTRTAATFTASGTPLLRVRITSNQNQIFVVRDGGTETMRVNRFRFDGGRSRFLDAAGELTYKVGGQIHVGSNQAPGTYRGSFNVTIEYF